MRWVRICGGSGERNRKGRLPRASYGVPDLWDGRYPWWGGSGDSANRGWKPWL